MTEDRREDQGRNDPGEEAPEDTRHGSRPWGPAGYDESGGTGLRPRGEDEVIGGGPSGGDEDPIGEEGIPDEAATEPEENGA